MDRGAGAIAERANAYATLCADGPETDDALLAELEAVTVLVRLGQAEQTRLAGEIADRSKDRTDSLATRQGAGSAANLVARITGVQRDQAGTMTASGRAFTGHSDDVDQTQCPQVAAAFAAGLLDPEVAAAMRRALAKSAPGLTRDELRALETFLLATAAEGWAADDLIRWLRKVPETAKPSSGDQPAPIPVVRRTVMQDGTVRWVLHLDAVTDGLLKTAIDANTTATRTGLITPDMPQPDPATDDRRPWSQRCVDGLARVAKKALKVDDGQVGGTAVTMLITMTLDALRSGLGMAQVPDCGTEIPASIARMLAADAEIIPVVLGGPSQPLDLGHGRRFFTEAQRRAMAIRDGGCAGPGCDAPASWCDGAHIRPAGYGPTNLDNGVLLCWRCHTLHDLQGWQLTREEDRWWWTPPPWIDATGRRRPGGRIPPLADAA